MNEEEKLQEFLKTLKICLSNASAYTKDHPYFIKSVDALKEKVDALLSVASPIKINFSAEAIFIEEKPLPATQLHKELVDIFHRRKIKSLQVTAGVTLDELLRLLRALSLASREIVRAGGMSVLCRKEEMPHVQVEELDYSLLLQDAAGEEGKDIWVYLFKEAQQKGDITRIPQLADDFEKIIGKIHAQETFEDKDMHQSIKQLLLYLKDKDKERFVRCSKAILKSIIKDKYSGSHDHLDEVKSYLKELEGDSFAEVLWEAIATDINFDATSFNLFTLLIDEGKHADIATILAGKIKQSPVVAQDAKTKKLIKELFFVPKGSYISGIYRNALSSLTDTLSSVNKYVFDRQSLGFHYRSILLNLLADETLPQRLEIAAEGLVSECKNVIYEKGLEYLSYVYAVIKQREEKDPALAEILRDLKKLIVDYLEQLVFEDDVPAEYEQLIETLDKSFTEPQVYLDKFFREYKINTYSLSLFLKFFPQELPVFYSHFRHEAGNLELVERLLANIEEVQSPLTCEILKNIFYDAHTITKLEILRMMKRLAYWDKNFFFALLVGEDTVLKKEALSIIKNYPAVYKEALDMLLLIPSRFGNKDSLIIKNIIILEELRIQEARGYLERLSKQFFLCHMELIKKCQEVLKRWNGTKD